MIHLEPEESEAVWLDHIPRAIWRPNCCWTHLKQLGVGHRVETRAPKAKNESAEIPSPLQLWGNSPFGALVKGHLGNL